MLLYIVFNSYSILWLLITLNFIFFNLTSYLLFTNRNDLYYRLLNNDFFLNNFYFFWTSLWYIPFFFIVLIGLNFLAKNKMINFFNFNLLFFLLILLWLTQNNFYNNQKIYSEILLFNEGINSLLTNSINKIHPLLLYSSILFFYFVNDINFYKFRIHIFNKKILSYFIKLNFFLNLIITALFLGSWWALQEGSWGGWWNWDSSEVFGLFILYKILLYSHITFFSESIVFLTLYNIFSRYFLLIYYLFMQINFSFISHNFGFRKFEFINIEIYFMFILFICLLNLIIVVNKYSFLNNYLFKKGTKFKIKLSHFFLFSLSFILLTSVLLLVNNFLWINFSINILNNEVKFNWIFIISMLIIFYICFNIYHKFIFLSILYLKKLYLFFIILLNYFYNFNIILLFHIFLLNFLLLTLNNSKSVIDIWLYTNFDLVNDTIFLIKINLQNIFLNQNFLSVSSTFENKSFNLIFSVNFLNINFYPLNLNSFFSIKVLDLQSTYLYLYFLIYFIIWKQLNRKIIMF